ncbi:hypothetical protein HUS91_36210 [Pseudomonas chlororaphis]|uniref:hypothetical protein n=1 Tax=Pseudomonas chlororaphis TaxID=587753 RepID=UPI000F55DDFF|nr:hypothetical protein [Pseudomonas chlororaphis]MBP5089953.1 hypothetical protein [Pseudomonas chlororaphis]MBP5090843.1 hypothetical protein [Pseudomonas chlororaphis]
MNTQNIPNHPMPPAAKALIGAYSGTAEPAIHVSIEYSDDYDDYHGKGSWKWVAKRSWTSGGATRIEILEVPQNAEGAEAEDVQSMIRALTREPLESKVKYAVSRADEEPRYVAVRIE